MTTKDSSSGSGIGFFGFLGIVFITLKLMGFIDWSWWWVTAPLWGGFTMVLSIAAFVFAAACVFVAIEAIQGRKARKQK